MSFAIAPSDRVNSLSLFHAVKRKAYEALPLNGQTLSRIAMRPLAWRVNIKRQAHSLALLYHENVIHTAIHMIVSLRPLQAQVPSTLAYYFIVLQLPPKFGESEKSMICCLSHWWLRPLGSSLSTSVVAGTYERHKVMMIVDRHKGLDTQLAYGCSMWSNPNLF